MTSLSLSSTVRLRNGVEMPILGIGTSHDGGFSRSALSGALRLGVSHVDTAQRYGTEELVADSIQLAGVERKRLFLTTKIWPSNYGYQPTVESLESSLRRLRTDYVDVVLLHWPDCPSWFKDKEETMSQTWRALEDLLDAGKCRAIGVSNFQEEHLEELFGRCRVEPHVNQIEVHPYCRQESLIQLCRDHEIVVEGYSPLAKGQILHIPYLRAPLESIASKQRKTIAQIVIRWCLQHQIVCIPKSTKPERLEENTKVFDFNLNEEEMRLIDSLSSVSYLKTSWEPKELELFQRVIEHKTRMNVFVLD